MENSIIRYEENKENKNKKKDKLLLLQGVQNTIK